MTLSSPPEQALRARLDRPGDPPSRRVARIAGIFMVITFISIPALLLYGQVLHHTNFVLGAGGGDARVYVGALFEIFTLIAGIGMAVTLYPVLRRQSEGLALGYVTVRVVESCLIAVGIVSLLAVVTLRRDLAGAAGTDHASLILSGRLAACSWWERSRGLVSTKEGCMVICTLASESGGVALAAPTPGRPLARRPSAVRTSHTRRSR